jgi:hypothetical protein
MRNRLCEIYIQAKGSKGSSKLQAIGGKSLLRFHFLKNLQPVASNLQLIDSLFKIHRTILAFHINLQSFAVANGGGKS